MGKHKTIIERIRQQGVIPLFYHDDATVSHEVVQALYDGGIRIIEYTNRGEAAFENFKSLVRARDKQWPGLLLALGTVKSLKDAKAAIKCEPDFIISPGLHPEAGEKITEEGILWIPGCMTPSEIMRAEEAGVRLVKLFPGSNLGPQFVAAIKELFPAMEFMPTGGVELSEENIRSWFKAGVCAVGLGSKVISKELLDKKDYAGVTERAKEALAIIQAIKK